MNAIHARLAAVVASFLLARLATGSVLETSPELAAALERWVSHSFELLLLLGYAVVHPWIQQRTGSAPATQDHPEPAPASAAGTEER